MSDHPHSHVAIIETMGGLTGQTGLAALPFNWACYMDDGEPAIGYGPTPEAAAIDALETGWLTDEERA